MYHRPTDFIVYNLIVIFFPERWVSMTVVLTPNANAILERLSRLALGRLPPAGL